MRTTCLQTIVGIVLKELRLERGVHQAQIADFINKTPSSVAKMEMGQMTLSIESLYSIAYAHGVSASQVLFAAEHYARLLTYGQRWYISRNTPEQDDLAIAASNYYSRAEFRNRQYRGNFFGEVSILAVQQSWMSEESPIPEVFRFALEATY